MGVRALAKELGVKEVTIYRWIEKGMPYSQISDRKKVFDREEVKAWLLRGQK